MSGVGRPPYPGAFFAEFEGSSREAARVIVPLVMEFVSPRSVIDVGCGIGVWLGVFRECGVEDIFGVDGEWVDAAQLVIPRECFAARNLEAPLGIGRTADLAVCLEVGEHLPASSADTLVGNLTAAAGVVLFSAAIPLQGGLHHVNEQWPEYWAERFAARGYVPVDCIRRRIWNDPRVSFFYAQNILVYARKDLLPGYPKLEREVQAEHDAALPLVHPRMYLHYGERWRLISPWIAHLPAPLVRGARRWLERFKRP